MLVTYGAMFFSLNWGTQSGLIIFQLLNFLGIFGFAGLGRGGGGVGRRGDRSAGQVERSGSREWKSMETRRDSRVFR
jgi:hypothetical protein